MSVSQARITLAPAIGRLVARELVDGIAESALAGYRLDRFYDQPVMRPVKGSCCRAPFRARR